MLFEQTKDKLIEDMNHFAKRLDVLEKSKEDIKAIGTALVKIPIQSVELNLDDLTLNVSGDRHVLNAAYGALRKLGYLASSKPREKETYYSAFFTKPGHLKIWFSFASTSCRRIKIGTETREVDIYETVCE